MRDRSAGSSSTRANGQAQVCYTAQFPVIDTPAGELKGAQVYDDNGSAQPLRMKSTDVLAVVCAGTDATIYGTAR